MSLRTVTANLCFTMGGDADYLTHLCEDADVVDVQEAKNVHLAKVAPSGFTGLQDTTDAAHMGTGILVRDATVEVKQHGVTLGVKPFLRTGKRVKMLTRYIYSAHLVEKATGEGHHAVSAHFPPSRFSPLQIPYRRALAGVLHGHPRSVVGTDANQPITRVAGKLGLKSYGRGIVGLLWGKGVKVSHGDVSRWGVEHKVTDHPSVAGTVTVVDRAPTPAPTPTPAPKKDSESYPAIAAARHQSHDGPQFGTGECQMRVHDCYDIPSIGDFDRDGMADAEDAWKFATKKHPGDQHPPRGYPVFWGGGSHDNGHVAISAGRDSSGVTHIWSTDIRRPGYFDYVPLSEITQRWGLPYLGWTEDYDGYQIVHGAKGAPVG